MRLSEGGVSVSRTLYASIAWPDLAAAGVALESPPKKREPSAGAAAAGHRTNAHACPCLKRERKKRV